MNELSNENRKILPTNGINVVFAHFCQPKTELKNSERLKQNTLEEILSVLCQNLGKAMKQMNKS